MSEQIPKTPAERMLPNPHIRSVQEGEERFYSPEDITSLQKEFSSAHERNFEGEIPAVTEMGRAVMRLAQEARENTTDARSGLLNPKGLEMWFNRYKPEQFAFIMCDGRGFGQINKKHGHEVGNEVIRFMGKKITSELRVPGEKSENEEEIKRKNKNANDVVGSVQVAQDIEGSVSARWGGDEFIIVVDLTGLDEEEATNAVESVTSRLDDFGVYEDEEKGIRIPVSVRSAAVLGTKKEKKPFSYYQSEVDSKLKEVTEKEKEQEKFKKSYNKSKSIDVEANELLEAELRELEQIHHELEVDNLISEIPKYDVSEKGVIFGGKHWDTLDIARNGLDNFLQNIGGVLNGENDLKTELLEKRGLGNEKLLDLFAHDYPTIAERVRTLARERITQENGRRDNSVSAAQYQQWREATKDERELLTTYVFWHISEQLWNEDKSASINLLKQ